MVKPKLTVQQTRWVSMALMALAAILLVDAIYQVGMHIVWRQWLPSASAATPAATQPASTQPASTQPGSTRPASSQPETRPKEGPPGRQGNADRPPKPHEVSAAIKKRNVFMPVPPKGHGMRLTGVIGRIALFQKGGKTVGIEEGQSAQGIKVVSIRDYDVTIEYDGKPETMKLFSGAGGGPGGPSMGGGPSGGPPMPEMRERAAMPGRMRVRPGLPEPGALKVEAGPGSMTATRPAEGRMPDINVIRSP
jgi:hypothetical protein